MIPLAVRKWNPFLPHTPLPTSLFEKIHRPKRGQFQRNEPSFLPFLNNTVKAQLTLGIFGLISQRFFLTFTVIPKVCTPFSRRIADSKRKARFRTKDLAYDRLDCQRAEKEKKNHPLWYFYTHYTQTHFEPSPEVDFRWKPVFLLLRSKDGGGKLPVDEASGRVVRKESA